MKLYLNVPFAEKEEAKALGARWNPTIKLWFIEVKDSINPLLKKWLIRESFYNLLAEQYTIVSAKKVCWKCENEMIVSTFLLQNYYELSRYEDNILGYPFLNWQEVHNVSFVSNITALDLECLAGIVRENPEYRKTYSKTLQGSYFANNCPYCRVLQGDFNLYNEPDGVFYDYRDSAKFTIMKTLDSAFKAEGNTALTAGSPEGIMIKVIGH